jgi:hypothetical protein
MVAKVVKELLVGLEEGLAVWQLVAILLRHEDMMGVVGPQGEVGEVAVATLVGFGILWGQLVARLGQGRYEVEGDLELVCDDAASRVEDEAWLGG